MIPWRSYPSNHAWRFCSSFWLHTLMGYSWSWKETLYRCLIVGFAREWVVRNFCLRAKTRIFFGCRRWQEYHAFAWTSNSHRWHSSPLFCYQGYIWFCADSTQKSTGWKSAVITANLISIIICIPVSEKVICHRIIDICNLVAHDVVLVSHSHHLVDLFLLSKVAWLSPINNKLLPDLYNLPFHCELEVCNR